MLPDWLPWLLQVNDSQFPSGSYAHSMGLEELVQRGLVRNPDDLETFLLRQILPGLLNFDLPFLVRSHQAATTGSLATLRTLDDELEAWKLAAELRQASRQIGSRRLSLIRKLEEYPLLELYATSDAPCHHLIVASLEFRQTPVEAALCAYSYQAISGYAIAAMKLIRLGQERCQMLIRQAMTELGPGIRQLSQGEGGRIGWFNPLLEIAGMRHARAHERLFIS